MCIFIISELAMYRASLVAQTVKYLPAMKETQVQSQVRKIPHGIGNGNPLQYSCLEIPWTEEPGGYSAWDRRSWTRLSD